jgi:hypothetical protein
MAKTRRCESNTEAFRSMVGDFVFDEDWGWVHKVAPPAMPTATSFPRKASKAESSTGRP